MKKMDIACMAVDLDGSEKSAHKDAAIIVKTTNALDAIAHVFLVVWMGTLDPGVTNVIKVFTRSYI